MENVFWPTGGGPAGVYEVGVVYYGRCTASGPVSYEVEVRLDGRLVDTVSGTLYDVGERHFIGEYNR